MAATVFYATSATSRRLGSPIKKRHTLSRDESKELRNLIKEREAGKAIQVGLASSIIGGAITSTVASIGYSITVGAGIGIATAYFGVGSSLSTKFDNMATGARDCNTVELTYTYRPRNGQEGAYWLTDVKVID